MANYIMVRDEGRKDNGCPGYIENATPNNRLVVRIYAPFDMDSLGTRHILDPEQVVSIAQPVFQRLLGKNSKARKDAHDYIQKETEFVLRLRRQLQFAPKEIIFDTKNRTTIVFWEDGEKTVVKCASDDEFSEYGGFAAAITKKIYGGTGAVNQLLKEKSHYKKGKKVKKTFEEILQEGFDKMNEAIAMKSPSITEVNKSENGQ